LSKLQGAPGRFERIVSSGGKIAIIDYAHTPDALENVLKTIHDIRKGKEKIITVVGAGGDRDKKKRPEMARIAAKYSDWVILTSDNPRTEDPAAILNDMLQGISPETNYKTLVIQDRSQAIKTAEKFARAGDIILIAGKGHENYQIIGTEKNFFSDKKEIIKYFNQKQ
jgi:UDP-N-acetylmuramoyl-L-alanyl-D-glutamate--2,6-diaminopimelate ligase